MYKIINYYKQKNKTFLLGLLLFLVGVAQLKAQTTPLLTESFNYPNSTALTSANWANIASAGTNNVTAYSGNLTYSGTIGNTIGNKATLTDNGQDVSRSFTSTNVTTSVPMYVSMVVNVSDAKTGDYFFMLGGVPVYIRTNGSGGFNFGINKTDSALTVQYESTARTLNQNYLLVLKYEVVAGTTNDVVKLFVNPSLSTEPSTADVSYTLTGATAGTDVTSFSSLSLYQGTALTSPKLDIDGINVGTTWASVTSAAYDYGDLPVSYDTSKDNVFIPAVHAPLTGFYMGSSAPDLELGPASVSSGADNNGTNGDGADEDAVSTPQSITSGAPFSVTIPVNTTVTGTKYLYAWIDFNGDGIFNGNEIMTATPYVTAGTVANVPLTWTSTNAAASVLAAGKTYARFRLSDTSLTNDNNGSGTATDLAKIDTRSYGLSLATGEIEDYQFLVDNLYDYGDVPVSYEKPGGTSVPARQAASSSLYLGSIVPDIEAAPASVSAGSENNNAGDNAVGLADEDGINSILYTITESDPFTLPVSVYNNTGSSQTLYGWIDFNKNGVFEPTEVTTVSVPVNIQQQTVNLTWAATATATITSSDNLYVRLRISKASLTDNSGTTYDERAIADGQSTGTYGTPAQGEIEDYLLPVLCKGYREFNSTAGNDDINGLKVQISGAGNLQVYRNTHPQIYVRPLDQSNIYSIPGTQHGLNLSIGGTNFYTGSLKSSGLANGGYLTVISDTCEDSIGPDGGTQKDVIKMKATKNGLDYFLTVTYTYTKPNWFMNIDYKVDIPAGNTELVQLSHGWDTYLSGGDAGPGFIKGTAPYYTMGVIKTDAYEAFRYKSGVAWSGYYSAKYSQLSNNLGSNNTFKNTIDPSAGTDNGIGISMNFGSNPGTYSSNNDLVFRCDAVYPSLSTNNTAVCSTTTNLNSLYNGATLPSNVILRWYDSATGTLLIDPQNAPVPGQYEVEEHDTVNDCTSGRNNVAVTYGNCTYCYKPAATGGTVLDTKHGISALGRAGVDNGNWPMVRKGAWTALESKEKGFVINRVAFSGGNPVGIAATNFVEGMMVYDTTNNCLKVYTSQDGGTTFGWYCMTTQTCPDY